MESGLIQTETGNSRGATLLSVRGLKKRYGNSVALDGVNLDVRAGDIYGFLGRNGAGKSTTIKALAGLVRPDGGDISFFGSALPRSNTSIRARVGFLIENPAFHPSLDALENLYCHQILRGIPEPKAREEIRRNLDLVGLTEAAHRNVGGYSTGMRQRLGLAQAFLGAPDMVVLDEPLNGLDPEGIYNMRKLILDVAAEKGTTFFISSHILAEVEQMCNRLGFVARGRVVAEGSLEELGTTGWILMRVDRPGEALDRLKQEWPKTVPRITEDQWISLRLEESRLPELIRWAVNKGHDLYEVMRKPRSLEETFMALTADREGGASSSRGEAARPGINPPEHGDASTQSEPHPSEPGGTSSQSEAHPSEPGGAS